ncbi:dicarboxylate/amino acid:cation symporter [Shewanella surugensis]|uniref:Dicarboxylate/amino acid:cation symporter n=1 Tax=Shewanella surugensis TaxID=212020 RepID=A0ABT0LE06_9GAMM|nr:dicarboxylate/amino acid:cation symporter [Shewanella surugensis]MCL1125933.1 dicarboxylate/amino acid:cation symporter [Shewanella surugensis]
MQMWLKILLSVFLGAIAGYLIGPPIDVIQPVGDIFLNLIRMLVIPLVFSCIITAITANKDLSNLTHLGLRSVSLYILTTLMAALVGLTFALVFHVGDLGNSLPLISFTNSDTIAPPSIINMLVDIFPTNPIASMAEGNMIQTIVFAIFIGVAINLSGEKGNAFKNAIDSMGDVMLTLMQLVIKIAPVGIFAIIAVIAGTQGINVLTPLIKLLVLVYVACLTQIYGVYALLLTLIAKVSPLPFFKKVISAQLMAFSSSSSVATLPITLDVAKKRLGVSKETAHFVLPLGMTINMDGSSLNYVLSSIFIANIAGIDLSTPQYVLIIFVSIITSIGAAGVPAVAMSGLFVVVATCGLPIEGIAIVLAIDRLMDMIRTATSVTGDLAVTTTVDSLNNTLDKKHYKSKGL